MFNFTRRKKQSDTAPKSAIRPDSILRVLVVEANGKPIARTVRLVP